MSLTLPVTSADVPLNLQCLISDPNWQLLVSLLSVTSPDGSKIVIGSDEPAPADRIYLWYRTNPDGTPRDGHLYRYIMGAWLSLHQLPPGVVTIYRGTAASIDTFDGGEAGAITPTTGPFWARVTELNARFPLGLGTLPSGTVLGMGDQGGEEKHVLIGDELPSADNVIEVNNITGFIVAVSANGSYELATNPGTAHRTVVWEGNDLGHNTMPPYTVVLFIERTARLYRRVP